MLNMCEIVTWRIRIFIKKKTSYCSHVLAVKEKKSGGSQYRKQLKCKFQILFLARQTPFAWSMVLVNHHTQNHPSHRNKSLNLERFHSEETTCNIKFKRHCDSRIPQTLQLNSNAFDSPNTTTIIIKTSHYRHRDPLNPLSELNGVIILDFLNFLGKKRRKLAGDIGGKPIRVEICRRGGAEHERAVGGRSRRNHGRRRKKSWSLGEEERAQLCMYFVGACSCDATLHFTALLLC